MTQHSGAYVFALAGKADADNIIPVIWEMSRDGTPCVVVISDRGVFQAQRDARWVRERASVKLILRASTEGDPSLIERLRRLTWNRAVLRRLLRVERAKLVAVQWGEGVAHDSTPVLRRLLRWSSTNLQLQLQLAAKELEIPTVALPHGHSTKTTIIRSRHVQERSAANGDLLPFADRDSFTAYVFCSGYHRDAIVKNSDMSATNTVVWGSPRFNDAWVPQLYALTPVVNLPVLAKGALRRVLFFVPKWQNLVDRAATMQLITALGADDRLQLVVRGHLRADAAALAHEERAALERGNVVLITDDVASASLIKACDVVVDVDSSIAFDAVLLGKPYVRPRYLQDSSVKTIWDELGGAHQTDSLDATVALLTAESLVLAERDRTFERVVFGGPGVAVLARYRDGLRSVAAQSRI